MKIAILFHKKARRNYRKKYDVGIFAEIWERQGHQVIALFGIDRFIPADVCIVHVDLTVVPDNYLEFAHRYPFVVNGHVKDISKNTFSNHLLNDGDIYAGKVIVKSNQNSAGWPEFAASHNILLQAWVRLVENLGLTRSRYYSGSKYQIYENLDQVPERVFDNPYFVVEKFLPEKIAGVYYVNMYLFFGDCHECFRLGSPKPVVKGKSIISREQIKPHPEIIKLRKQFNLDFGKLDYCMNQGKPVLLDVNKIVGYGGFVDGQIPSFEDRANGLFDLIPTDISAGKNQ